MVAPFFGRISIRTDNKGKRNVILNPTTNIQNLSIIVHIVEHVQYTYTILPSSEIAFSNSNSNFATSFNWNHNPSDLTKHLVVASFQNGFIELSKHFKRYCTCVVPTPTECMCESLLRGILMGHRILRTQAKNNNNNNSSSTQNIYTSHWMCLASIKNCKCTEYSISFPFPTVYCVLCAPVCFVYLDNFIMCTIIVLIQAMKYWFE